VYVGEIQQMDVMNILCAFVWCN